MVSRAGLLLACCVTATFHLLVSAGAARAQIKCPGPDQIAGLAPSGTSRFLIIQNSAPNTFGRGSPVPPCETCYREAGSACGINAHTSTTSFATAYPYVAGFEKSSPSTELLILLPQGLMPFPREVRPGGSTHIANDSATFRLGDNDKLLPIKTISCPGGATTIGDYFGYIDLPRPEPTKTSKCQITITAKRAAKDPLNTDYDTITYSGATLERNSAGAYAITAAGTLSGGFYSNEPLLIEAAGQGADYIFVTTNLVEAATGKENTSRLYDFGKLQAGSGAVSNRFRISNMGVAGTVGHLDARNIRISKVDAAGNQAAGTPAFSFDVAPWTSAAKAGRRLQLVSGAPVSFSVKFDPPGPGTYFARVVLALASADPQLTRTVHFIVKGEK